MLQFTWKCSLYQLTKLKMNLIKGNTFNWHLLITFRSHFNRLRNSVMIHVRLKRVSVRKYSSFSPTLPGTWCGEAKLRPGPHTRLCLESSLHNPHYISTFQHPVIIRQQTCSLVGFFMLSPWMIVVRALPLHYNLKAFILIFKLQGNLKCSMGCNVCWSTYKGNSIWMYWTTI